MTCLSVNINKVATLRNSRGGNVPDLLKVAQDLQAFGAQGITIHPRPDLTNDTSVTKMQEIYLKLSKQSLISKVILQQNF